MSGVRASSMRIESTSSTMANACPRWTRDLGVGDHVVAQVVEAELGVGAVGDIRLVGLLALGGLRTVLDEADLHAEEAVDLAHPLAVALGEVIVDGDDVDTGPREGVEVAREGGHERLALAGLHLCDLPRVQDHAADELDVEVTQPDGALGCLADDGERLGHQLVERLAVGEALAELRRLAAELFIAELRNLVFEIVDFSYPAAEGLDLFARSGRREVWKESLACMLPSKVGVVYAATLPQGL